MKGNLFEFRPVCRGQGGTLLSQQRSVLKGVVVLCHVYRSFLVWNPMSIFILDLKTIFVFLPRWRFNLEKIWSINHFGPKGSKMGQKKVWKIVPLIPRKLGEKSWFYMHFEDIPKGKFFLKRKTAFQNLSTIPFFAHNVCTKTGVLKIPLLPSWWQPTTQLKIGPSNPKEFRARAVLHHIGVQNAASLIVCGRLEFQMDEFSTAQN